MFGFAKLFAIGALAISASAAPLLNADDNTVGPADIDVSRREISTRSIHIVETGAGVLAGVSSVNLGAIDADDCGCANKTLQSIFIAMKGELTPLAEQIAAVNCTGKTVAEISAVVEPIVGQIVDALDGGVASLKSLSDMTIEQILASTDGGASLGVGDVAQLLASLLELVLNPTGTLLGAIQGDYLSELGLAFLPVMTSLATLVQGVTTLIGGSRGGLIGKVVSLIQVGDVIPVIQKLNVPALISILCL